MADQTSGAVSSLLGILSAAIKDEARLLSGVEGDIQFIKDEMDSMNGFLMHLNNTEMVHDDQLRAWMKQVRDIAYMAQDYIELYKRDLTPPQGGSLWASLHHLRVYLQTIPTRRSLANKIRELKDRVREVGERRLRYDVKLPNATAKLKPMPVAKDSRIEEKREDFLHALEEEDDEEDGGGDVPHSPSLSRAISMLPYDLAADEAHKLIDGILYRLAGHARKMLLCALYAYPYGTVEELKTLKEKLDVKRADLPKEVMVFSYSKLSTHYKSCLQYLTAFLEEESISRTVLIRRWLAEGLVARDAEVQAMEEAGEQCFSDLIFRGFLRPATPAGAVTVSGLKIKSCTFMNKSVRDFIISMSESENFVSVALPTHLRLQDDIRKLVQRPPPQQHQVQKPWPWYFCDNHCVGGIPRKPQHYVAEFSAGDTATADQDDGEVLRHPMDEMADILKRLPQEYRINVLDLGGSRGLNNRHLKTICTKLSLKYLSLRGTEVSRLPRSLSNLWQLETLDIRQTDVRDTDMEHIFLPKLKHLLAGHIDDSLRLRTVRLPRKLGRDMEILRHVNIVHGKAELEKIGRLKQLRKLGVVLDGSKDNIIYFLNTISKLSKSLRSLSVWIAEEEAPLATASGVAVTVPLDYKEDIDSASFFPPRLAKLDCLNIKGKLGGSLTRRMIMGNDKLSKITLRNTKLTRDGLNALGELKHLRCLRLLRGSYTEAEITLTKDEFQDLRLLVIDDHVAKIAFESGAAPKLEKIVWTSDRVDAIAGIGKLKSLKEFELNCDLNNPGIHHVEVEEALPSRLLKSGTAFRAHQSS